MAPFPHRPFPALLPLLLLYASSAPEYSSSAWVQDKALSVAPKAEEVQRAGAKGTGEVEEAVGSVEIGPSENATVAASTTSEGPIAVEETAFLNATQNIPMLPAPLAATKENLHETAGQEPPPSLLQALLSSTATITAAAEGTAPTISTTEPNGAPTLGHNAGVAITAVPPWVPPIHHMGHHHGGSSRFGPYFEEGGEGSNVTARLGSTVRLDCKIGMLQDKTVTWLHRKDDAIHLLTVGRQAYSSDSRFSLAYRYPNNWRLQILFVNRRDEGLYECQVATHPPRIRQVFLRVTAPVLKIVDENHHEVLERYYKAGSEVELTCLASQLEEGDGMADDGDLKRGTPTTPLVPLSSLHKGVAGRVLWRHGDSAISHNSTGIGIGVNTSADGRNVAVTLTLEAARKGDGGNYTCSVGGLSSATVAIHILNGELPAAVQHGNSTVPFGVVSMWLQLCCLALSLSVITR